MVMTAYLDESGTHGKESPIVTIAGFIASTDQWNSYADDLSQLLAEYGVKVFHANRIPNTQRSLQGLGYAQASEIQLALFEACG
jgi:hypothetical protein